FICSQNEPMVAQMTEEYRRAPEPKRLVLLPGTGHAQHIFPPEPAEDPRTTGAALPGRRAPAKNRTGGRAVAVRGCPRAVAPVVLRTRLRPAPADRAGAQRRERRASP